jgi:hypothetical protein
MSIIIRVSVLSKNKILRCYNMFPSMFPSIEAMTDYLPHLAGIGFNAVWINPIQLAEGEALSRSSRDDGLRMKVKNSLYAMSTEKEFDPRIQGLSKATIQSFCQEAVGLGMQPMFDLVLNHVSATSPLKNEHPDWFKQGAPEFPDTISFDYEGPGKEQIIQYWKKYIDTYMDEYGFQGARIDCIPKLLPHIRKELYAHISNKNPHAFILEEALFSSKTSEEFAKEIQAAGGTHITGSAYYRKRDGWGGFERSSPGSSAYDANTEEFWKRSMVTGGVINFTGNHDHHTCAMRVCMDMALERLEQDPISQAGIQQMIEEEQAEVYRRNKGKDRAGLALSADKKQVIALPFLYHHVTQIITEAKDPASDSLRAWRLKILDKMTISMLAGSGGYYMLSGDEVGCVKTPSVFQLSNGKPTNHCVLPNIFLMEEARGPAHLESFNLLVNGLLTESGLISLANPISSIMYEHISTIAKEAYKESVDRKMKGKPKQMEAAYQHRFAQYVGGGWHTLNDKDLDDDVSKEARTLANTIVDKLRYKHNILALKLELKSAAGDNSSEKALDQFVASLNKNFPKLVYSLNKDIPHTEFSPENPGYYWDAPALLSDGIPASYIKQVNTIIENLPTPDPGFWCEIFKGDKDFERASIVVRKNGAGYDSRTDIIVVNIDPLHPIIISEKELDTIAVWFRDRGFPPGWPAQENAAKNAYHSVLPREDKPVYLHLGVGVEMTEGLTTTKGLVIATDNKVVGLSSVPSARMEAPPETDPLAFYSQSTVVQSSEAGWMDSQDGIAFGDATPPASPPFSNKSKPITNVVGPAT